MSRAQQTLEIFAKHCPETWRRVADRKYILPHYRQLDYYLQDSLHELFLDFLVAYGSGMLDRENNLAKSTYANEALSLHYGRPTLYLERELGEALIRTELLTDFSPEDIRWRWPQLRIMLPQRPHHSRESGRAALAHILGYRPHPGGHPHPPS